MTNFISISKTYIRTLTGCISYHTFRQVSLDKMLETTVIFLLCFSHFVGAYNVDTTSPVELTSPTNDGFFGLSVALSKDYVYVGAPSDDTHGNVYECECESGSCSVIDGKPFEIFSSMSV